MKKIIVLYWFDIKVGYLFFKRGFYIFYPIKDSLKYIKNKACILDIMPYFLSEKKYNVSKQLPPVFDCFIYSDKRIDLISSIGSHKEDKYLTLLSIANHSDELDKKGFWISSIDN